ncbi:MAG TPA: DMT family transporter [Candidatus Nitrosopolaris sp.]|nr:DMT family transporter [Candidatus Nitrosopolaris sp.]
MSEGRAGLLPYIALVALALIWGVSFLFIKVAVHDMSPIVLVLIRSASACIALALIVRVMGRPLFGEGWRGRIIPFVLLGITGGLLPWAAIAWGEERISSGLASILNSTTPLWAAVLVYWIIPSGRPSAVNHAGVLIGFAGVVILVVPDLASKGLAGNAVGAIAVVLASLSYAVNALYARRKLRSVSVYEVSLGQLAATAVFAFPFAAPLLSSVHVALPSMAAVVALGVGGSAIGLLLYFYIMNKLGPVQATGVTLLVPVTAVFWGVILLHEELTLPIVAGMVVILTGVVLTNLRTRKRAKVSEKERAAA